MSDLTPEQKRELSCLAEHYGRGIHQCNAYDNPPLYRYVERILADLRESIAADIEGHHGEDCACGCPDPNPDNVPIALLETCRRTRDAAARIARGGER